MSEIKVEKKLKNPAFRPLDTAIACTLFIVLQFVVSLVIGYMPQGVSGSLIFTTIASFCIEGAFALSVFITGRTRNVEIFEATKLNKKPSYKSFLLAAALSVITLVAYTSLTNVFMISIEKLGYNPLSDITIPNFGYYLLYVFLMCIVPAVFEESMFRGCILNGLRKVNVHFAVIASAAIFSLMHGSPDQTIHQLILGIILGYSLVYSGSLWIPISIHFLNNFIALTLGYIQGAGEPLDVSTITWGELGRSLALALVLAAAGTALVVVCMKALKKLRDQDHKLAENDKPEAKAEEGQKLEVVKKNSHGEIYTILLYVCSLGYLLFEWVLTLISRI